MLKIKIRNVVIWAVLLMLALISIVQYVQMKRSYDQPENAVYLLHQVAAFQFELLASSLQEAESAGATDELNSLRQTLYTMNFTHEQLVSAVGAKKITPLSSIMDTMQYILRLQLGGNRPLQVNEKEAIRQLNEKIQQMFTIYRHLFLENDSLVSSKNKQLSKLDEELSALLERFN